jgi:hypothetical protein
MKRPTCEELGFCQALAECPLGESQTLAECHVACSTPPQKHYPFAPGVIEGMGPSRVEAISRAVLVLACLAALGAVVGFAAGYFNLQGLLT